MIEKTNDENRELFIRSMTRAELMDFIWSKDSYYSGESFDGYTDNLLLVIAIFVDIRDQADRQEKGVDIDTTDITRQQSKQDWKQQDYRTIEYLKTLSDFTKKVNDETKNKS
jgi:hypothetical protein